MIQKPNFKKAYILANEMLVASKSITTFPFDVEKVVSEETDLKFDYVAYTGHEQVTIKIK